MFRKHRGLVTQESPSIIPCESWEMHWLSDEDMYNNHGDIDGNKKALLKRERKKWSSILGWVYVLVPTAQTCFALACLLPAWRGRMKGLVEIPYIWDDPRSHSSSSDVHTVLTYSAQNGIVQLTNSPAFCDKGPPIMIHEMIHFSKYCQWASIYWGDMPSAEWDAVGYQHPPVPEGHAVWTCPVLKLCSPSHRPYRKTPRWAQTLERGMNLTMNWQN